MCSQTELPLSLSPSKVDNRFETVYGEAHFDPTPCGAPIRVITIAQAPAAGLAHLVEAVKADGILGACGVPCRLAKEWCAHGRSAI